jgi:hypothetical protein
VKGNRKGIQRVHTAFFGRGLSNNGSTSTEDGEEEKEKET